MHLYVRLEGDTIRDVTFEGAGCSISQASTSMMTQILEGKTVEEARALADRFKEMMHGDEQAATDARLGDARALAGVSRFPARIKCALLGWNALEEAVGEE